MSLYATWPEFSAGLLDASAGLALAVKWTAVLALAWLAHAMLAGRNPRWRVAIWRSAIVGLALVAVLSWVPPIVTYRLASRDQPAVGVMRSVSTMIAVEGQRVPAIVASWEPSEAISPSPAAASSSTPVVVNDPVPAETPGFPGWAGIVGWLWTTWLAGVLVLTARLIVGSLGLCAGHSAIVGGF